MSPESLVPREPGIQMTGALDMVVVTINIIIIQKQKRAEMFEEIGRFTHHRKQNNNAFAYAGCYFEDTQSIFVTHDDQ